MPKTIALVGNPNVGKSTLFNSLTGQNQKIINAPGTTVTVNKGWWQGNIVIDLPGLISFIHNSVDEKVAVDALLNKNNVLNPDLIILVADAMHISRSLYLLAQLKQLNIPIVLVVTMADIARKRQMDLDVEKISKILKLPTILIDSREAKGIKDLESLIYKIGRNLDTNKTKILFDSKKFIAETKNNFETNIKWVADIEKKLSISNIDKLTLSDRIDKVLLNKFFGSVFFLIILFLVFQFSTYISFPIIDFIDGPARNFITDNFSLLFSTGVWQNFVLSTIIATIFTLLEFVSPILFIFIALAILENCGYLARAALVSDKLMRGIGLEGNSILPIIIGFGCNLPAIKATRILKTSQIRRQTAFVIPYSLCSARFSIFIVLAHAFFYNNAGLIIFLLYIISVLFIIGISLICKVIRQLYNKKIALPKNRVSAFVIHLPVYQIPKFGFIFKSSLTKLTNFLWGAGRVIICVLAIMWCLQAIPVPNDNQTAETFGNVNNIHNSVYGLIADKTAPLFAPAGFGDWHLSQAIISGFLAKEVVLGSLSNAYAIDEVKTVSDNNTLTGSLQNTMNNASGGHVDLAAFSFMLFVLLYIPCLATVIGIKSEFGIRQSLITVLVSLSLAYIFSVLFYQIGIILLG